jgi:hypothetical protein
LIERYAAELHESAGRLALQMGVDNVERDAVERVLFDTTVLVARAREGAPHLASVLSDLMDGLQDQIGKAPWKDQPTSPWVSSGLERGEPFAWAISGAALHWLRAPDRFERAKPATSFFMEAARASGLDDSLAVPTGD